jgi:hypothetical protein
MRNFWFRITPTLIETMSLQVFFVEDGAFEFRWP